MIDGSHQWSHLVVDVCGAVFDWDSVSILETGLSGLLSSWINFSLWVSTSLARIPYNKSHNLVGCSWGRFQSWSTAVNMDAQVSQMFAASRAPRVGSLDPTGVLVLVVLRNLQLTSTVAGTVYISTLGVWLLPLLSIHYLSSVCLTVTEGKIESQRRWNLHFSGG